MITADIGNEDLGLNPEEMPLRSSSYNIYIDLPGDRETMLLVHGYTGAYDKVPRKLAAYVRSLEAGPVHKPLFGAWENEEIDRRYIETPSEHVIDSLRRRGFLTRKTTAQEHAYFVKHVAALRKQQRRSKMPSYIVMPSYDCNLRCHYCFQDFMRTDARYAHLLRVMSRDVADRVLRSFISIEEQRSVVPGKRHVTFFGGEPLTPATKPIVEYFVAKLRGIGPAECSAISNGTNLHLFSDLLGPEGISWLQITLDGTPAEHDKRRIHADGSGSFAAIQRNIGHALERGATIAVRVNVDRSSIGALPGLASYLVEQGWADHPNFGCYVAPVRDSLDKGTRGDFFNTWELGQEVLHLKSAFPDMRAVSPVDQQLKNDALAIFDGRTPGMPHKATFCGAHDGMFVFDPFADIYACWERTGDQNIRIGYVDESGNAVLNPVAQTWGSRDVTSNPTCSQCRFALHCGGGCAVLAEESSGTLFSNYCDAFGKRLRARVAEAFVDFQAGRVTSSAALRTDIIEAFVR